MRVAIEDPDNPNLDLELESNGDGTVNIDLSTAEYENGYATLSPGIVQDLISALQMVLHASQREQQNKR